jgi:MoaA/NifB/PqqE/SkfB family radical SAM enzyme
MTEARMKQVAAMRLFNKVLLEQERTRRLPVLSSRPVLLVIDPTNTCNLRCPFCPTGQRKKAQAPSFMPLEKFDRIMRTLKPYLSSVNFANWAEPLLHKDVYGMIASAKRHNDAYCSLSSNFHAFNERDAEKMVRSGLDYLIVAMDGMDQTSYERYRRGGSLDKVLENIRTLVTVKKAMKSRKPFIEWQYLVFKHNEKDMRRAVKLREELGVDMLKFKSAWIYGIGQNYDAWAPENRKFNRYEKDAGRVAIRYNRQWEHCDSPWMTIVIDSRGNVFPCCADIEEGGDFGNIFRDSFEAL